MLTVGDKLDELKDEADWYRADCEEKEKLITKLNAMKTSWSELDKLEAECEKAEAELEEAKIQCIEKGNTLNTKLQKLNAALVGQVAKKVAIENAAKQLSLYIDEDSYNWLQSEAERTGIDIEIAASTLLRKSCSEEVKLNDACER